MTGDEMEDAVLLGRIEGLADRLALRGRNCQDTDLTDAADLLRFMVKTYSWDSPDDQEGEGRRGTVH